MSTAQRMPTVCPWTRMVKQSRMATIAPRLTAGWPQSRYRRLAAVAQTLPPPLAAFAPRMTAGWPRSRLLVLLGLLLAAPHLPLRVFLRRASSSHPVRTERGCPSQPEGP